MHAPGSTPPGAAGGLRSLAPLRSSLEPALSAVRTTRTSRPPRTRTAALATALLAPLVLVAAPAPEAQAVPSLQVLRLSGPQFAVQDRYATAADIALVTYGGGADVVVLARGDAFADALPGGFLAGALDAPLLLTAPGAVPDATYEALEVLQPSTVVLLGGTGAVSAAVEEELAQSADVVRVSGDSRYATAAEITRAGAEPADLPDVDGLRTVLLANGQDFPDALAGGTVSAGSGAPLLLTAPGALPAETAAVLDEYDVEQVVVLGGTGAVSAAVEADVARRTGHDVVRLSGPDRYATSAAIADYAWDELGFDDAQVGLARGDGFADGLAAAARSGRLGGPVLLTPTAALAPATREALTERCTTLRALEVYGGGGAVAPAALEQARAAASTCEQLGRGAVTDRRDVRTLADDEGAGSVDVGTDDGCEVVRPLQPGVEYRVDLFDASTVDATGNVPVFDDPDGDGLAVPTGTAAVLTSVGGQPPRDRAAPGGPLVPSSRSSTALVRGEDLSPEALCDVVLEGVAEGEVVVVVHREGRPGAPNGEGGASRAVEVAQDGTPKGPAAAFAVQPFRAAAPHLGVFPTRVEVPPAFPADLTVTVTDMVPGADYRVLLVDARLVDTSGPEPVFTAVPGTDRADSGPALAVVGPAAGSDDAGPGTPSEDATGRQTAVVEADLRFPAAFVGYTARVRFEARSVGRVVPVLIRNGGGSADGTPERGGAQPYLELAADGTAAEALVAVGPVVELVDTRGPRPRGAEAVVGSRTVTVTWDEPFDCARVEADGRDFLVRYAAPGADRYAFYGAGQITAACSSGTTVALTLLGDLRVPAEGDLGVVVSDVNDLQDAAGNGMSLVPAQVRLVPAG